MDRSVNSGILQGLESQPHGLLVCDFGKVISPSFSFSICKMGISLVCGKDYMRLGWTSFAQWDVGLSHSLNVATAVVAVNNAIVIPNQNPLILKYNTVSFL